MEKSLCVEAKLSNGKKVAQTKSVSLVNEDLDGAGAGLKGTLAFLLTAHNDQFSEEELDSKAKQLAKSFEEAYLNASKGTILACLEEGLDSLRNQSVEAQIDVEIVAAVFWGLVLYIGRLGESEIFLWRDEKTKPIQFKFVASGLIKDGDTLALVNSAFKNSVSPEELSLILGREELNDVKNKLDHIQSDVESSDALILRSNLAENQNTEVPITFVDTDRRSGLAWIKNKASGFSPNWGSFLTKIEPIKEWLVKVKDKVKPILLRVIAELSAPWQKRNPGEIFDLKLRRRARLIQIAGLLTLLLVLSLSFSWVNSARQSRKKDQIKITNQIKDKLSQAKQTLPTDPAQTQVLLSQAEQLVQKAKKLGVAEIKDLQSQIEQLDRENKKIYQPSELTTLADLAGVSAVTALVVTDSTMSALDSTSGVLLKVDLKTGVSSKVAENKTAFKNLASGDDSVYLTGGQEAWSYDPGTGRVKKVLSGENSWGSITDTAVFSDNLYVLDAVKQEVWKQINIGAALTGARAYLSGDKPDLKTANALAIDGSVWIGTSEGNIYKFLAGKKEDFNLSGGPADLAITRLFTNSDTNQLYVLDAKASRVVIFSKTGGYLASYQDTKLKDASAIAVAEEAKTVYFGAGTKIYRFKFR